MSGEKSQPEVGLASLILPLYLPTLCTMLGYGMIVPVLPLFARSLAAVAWIMVFRVAETLSRKHKDP